LTRFLAALLFALAAVGLVSASTNDLDIARQALRDGLWEIARTHASRDASDAARLVVLESLAGEGRWDAIGKTLAGWKDAQGEGFDYYRAIAKGDHAAAMSILRKGGSAEGRAEATLYEAEELAKSGRREDAEALWRTLATETNVSRRVLALASMNLMDVGLLRRALAEADSAAMRRQVGLRLGVALLRDGKTASEGEKMVRSVVKDSPDVKGAKEALLAVADLAVSSNLWKEAYATYHEAIETWPDVARMPEVQESRGWALVHLGRPEEAREAFRRFGELANTDEQKAKALVEEGDVLQKMEKEEEAMAFYRTAIEKYPDAEVTRPLKRLVSLREMEARGRDLYRKFKFAEASEVFGEVAKADAARKPLMDFFGVLCLYGLGRDEEACEQARRIVAAGPDVRVRLDATLWLAKFLYNRREWKESGELFATFAERQDDRERAAEALLWAARAAFASSDFSRAIQFSTLVVERYPAGKAKPSALLVQGESLMELARYDEAVLVFERAVVAEGVSAETRVRAQMLKADALFAMGADNPSRYASALEAYRAVRFDGKLLPSEQIVLSFKIARSLEKLKRTDEAVDIYYSQVVLPYRSGRLSGQHLTDEARAAFSRAAFRLADECESRGKVKQAVNVLRLVAESGVPASDEAAKRISRLSNEGGVL